MWNEIADIKDIQQFMEQVDCFHDGVIKEIRYCSGAYVNDELAMHPINKKRKLDVII